MRNCTIHRPFLSLAIAIPCVLPLAAQASNWNICELRIEILAHHKAAHELEAIVLHVSSKPGVECPSKGAHMRFTPETADYQSDLPVKKWPKVGETTSFRYRYLDGTCKERGPCRITHYPFSR